MSKKKNVIFFILGSTVFIGVLYFISIRKYSIYGNDIVSIKIGKHQLYAELVLSDEKMRKGLGDRRSLCSHCGMLFDFQNAGEYPFWMKNMRFPLDIIWMLNGKVVHIEKNIQPAFTGVLEPHENSDMVLEINAGSVDRLGLKTNDVIIYR